MTTRARLTTLLILAVALLASNGCLFSPPESDKPPVETGPEYLEYTSNDNLIANFVESWNHMDFNEYRDQILYDGELMATDGEDYAPFRFYFIEPDENYGPSWGVDEELEHTQGLFSGNDALDGSPGVANITLHFENLSVWANPTNPFEVEGDAYPQGTQFRRYRTDMDIELKGTNSQGFNGYLVNDVVEFYVLPVDVDGTTEYRLWKWLDINN